MSDEQITSEENTETQEEQPEQQTAATSPFQRLPRPKVKDADWLRTIEDETWPEFVERMRQAPHIKGANDLGKTYAIQTSLYSQELQWFVSAKAIDRKVRDVSDLPKTIALMGIIQSFRERVASTQVGLVDIQRHLRRAYKPCEAWIKLHPFMRGKKDGDRKNAVHLILEELIDTLDDIESILKSCENVVWTLKQAADTYNNQKQGITTMVYAGKGTGGNPEHARR